jgi:hypothetical protein
LCPPDGLVVTDKRSIAQFNRKHNPASWLGNMGALSDNR